MTYDEQKKIEFDKWYHWCGNAINPIEIIQQIREDQKKACAKAYCNVQFTLMKCYNGNCNFDKGKGCDDYRAIMSAEPEVKE